MHGPACECVRRLMQNPQGCSTWSVRFSNVGSVAWQRGELSSLRGGCTGSLQHARSHLLSTLCTLHLSQYLWLAAQVQQDPPMIIAQECAMGSNALACEDARSIVAAGGDAVPCAMATCMMVRACVRSGSGVHAAAIDCSVAPGCGRPPSLKDNPTMTPSASQNFTAGLTYFPREASRASFQLPDAER